MKSSLLIYNRVTGQVVDCSVGWGNSLADRVLGVVEVQVFNLAWRTGSLASSGCDDSKLKTYSDSD